MRDYKELVERLHMRIALTYAGSPCQEDLLEAADAIKELLPSAEVEPVKRQGNKFVFEYTSGSQEPIKRGKWMEMGTNADGTHNIKCSECGAGYKTKGHANSILTKAKYKFCPRCGAKMNAAEM